MSDPIATTVNELRAACKAKATGEVSCTGEVEVEPHGARTLVLTVAPHDERWYLQVEIRRPKSNSHMWLKLAPRAEVIEFLGRKEMAAEVAKAVKDMADADFHTEGLPEHW